ncbi:hypothetical protein SG34_030665 [Thalassomonas viridans]|uniref:histidine kinase n=1 Tax=Thalassomonas viridans TaxID=137584 RepID=A0AAE9Z9A0_9GAMM|nr:ATP-binding protein [Thalassomonas viridans]WDE09131.1 hypothetical protein SG34_030665 [Thalassomonas viridans]
MNKSSLSLFPRLYLGIVLTVILSITLTRFVVEIYSEREELNFFIRDANYILDYIEDSQLAETAAKQPNIRLPFPFNIEFSARFVDLKTNEQVCTACEFLKTVDNQHYYELEEGERMMQAKLAGLNRDVIIYEKLDSERSSEELSAMDAEMDIGQLIFFLQIAVISLFLGLTIYRPIKKLQAQIKALIHSHRLFGEGNLTIKADENIQKPLDELAASFNEMARAIEENVKERDIFAQAIPHEVRTPLSRIQLASGLIRKKSQDLDVLVLLDDLDSYIVDINELIGQIVEFSRVNEHKDIEGEQYQNIKLRAFVESRVRMLANAHNKSLVLAIDNGLEIIANPIYLRLLIDNFIKNALNHGKEQIKVSAFIINKQLTIEVEDDGVGVPVNDRATIFIPFARLDKSRSRITGGLGLGLPIAKAAADKMGGEIKVSDSALGGASFSFIQIIHHK